MPAASAAASIRRNWNGCGDCLQPLATDKMPLEVPPPRSNRFGSPLVLSRVHWVRPELVAEVKFLTWTDDNLLRQVVYEGLREDKRSFRSAISRTAFAGGSTPRHSMPAHVKSRSLEWGGETDCAASPDREILGTGHRNDEPSDWAQSKSLCTNGVIHLTCFCHTRGRNGTRCSVVQRPDYNARWRTVIRS